MNKVFAVCWTILGTVAFGGSGLLGIGMLMAIFNNLFPWWFIFIVLMMLAVAALGMHWLFTIVTDMWREDF